MALQKEVNIKIKGKHVNGTIVNDVFLSEHLVISNSNKKGYTAEDIRSVIGELEELLETIEGINVTNILSES